MESDFDYQMPSYTTLMVNDLNISTRWYCDALGFSLISQMPGANGDPIMSHLRWAPHADLILMEEGPNSLIASIKGAGVTLNFTVLRESVDAIAERGAARWQCADFRAARSPVECARGYCGGSQWVSAQFYRAAARIC